MQTLSRTEYDINSLHIYIRAWPVNDLFMHSTHIWLVSGGSCYLNIHTSYPYWSVFINDVIFAPHYWFPGQQCVHIQRHAWCVPSHWPTCWSVQKYCIMATPVILHHSATSWPWPSFYNDWLQSVKLQVQSLLDPHKQVGLVAIWMWDIVECCIWCLYN